MKNVTVLILLLLITFAVAIETQAENLASVDESVKSIPEAIPDHAPENNEKNEKDILPAPVIPKDSALLSADAKDSLNHRSDAYNPNSKRYNPSSEQNTGGKTARDSANRAAELQQNQVAPKPLDQSVPEMQNSLNHRSDAFNPNSKRFNPSSQNGQGGKSSRVSAKKAAARQKALSDSKRGGGKINVSAAKYVLIQSFVRGILQHCIKKEQYNSTCIVDVGKDVGMSSAFALAFSYIPGATAIPYLLTMKTSCIDTESAPECIQAFVKLGASVVTTMASYSLGLGVLGPVIDGVAQHVVSEAIDYSADYIMSVAFPEVN